MDKNKFTCIMFTIVGTLSHSIHEYFNISYNESLSLLYHSKLYRQLEDETTKMWYYSNHDLLNMFIEEQRTGDYTIYG